MTENPKQIENIPPINKRSMVSENLDIKTVADDMRKEMEKPDFIPNNSTLFLFAVEKLHDIAVGVTEIAEAFKKAGGVIPTQTQQSKQINSTPAMVPVLTSNNAMPQSSSNTQVIQGDSIRLSEVKSALAEFLPDGNPLLVFDESTSAQFIIIKPKGFLGGGNFPKIAGIIKNILGGIYVSAGTNSHFEVPKIKQ
jgi:hypothetical protein